MPQQNSVDLAVNRWSAWAPGLNDSESWQEWLEGARDIGGPVDPDVSFVKPLLRRRLSPLNRMAFHVASKCLPDEETPICIFCSRYGEYGRAFEILSDLSRGEPISPNSFSLSVHNTTSSLSSIARNDRSHSTSIAAGAATLEAGFLEARSLLSEAPAAAALLVYYDEPLPALYEERVYAIRESAALAILLRLSQRDEPDNRVLRLAWQSSDAKGTVEKESTHPALRLASLLSNTCSMASLNDGRLLWTWSRHVTAN